MKLTKDTLAEIAHGAVRVEEENGKIKFFRFSEEQQMLYKNSGNESFYRKTFAPSGIKLEFETDSKSLYIKVNVSPSTTRSYFSIDICVNGELAGCLKNFDEEEMTGDYPAKSFPLGTFENRFELTTGEKTVTVFLPWSVTLELEEFSLDDGSFVKAVAKDKKMLVFGDSITQGYDAIHPSNHYISALSGLLNAEACNKAIGGEKFIPDLVKTDEAFNPDYIIVAYGTNDWAHDDKDKFKRNCKEFYELLSRKYPDSKIFALTPIWRKNYKEPNNCGEFSFIADYIKEVTEGLDNILCINGFNFIPHDENMYGDLRLHPNDEGFKHYAKNVYEEIKRSKQI